MRMLQLTRLRTTCALVLALSVSTACRTPSVRASIKPPPLGSAALKAELHELDRLEQEEGVDLCPEARDFLADQVAPYFAGIRAARAR